MANGSAEIEAFIRSKTVSGELARSWQSKEQEKSGNVGSSW
jgi:hypothetical protein